MDTQSWPGVAMTCLSLGCVCTALGDFQPRQGEGGGLSEIRSTGTGVQSIGSLFRFAPSCHENISVKKTVCIALYDIRTVFYLWATLRVGQTLWRVPLDNGSLQN